MQDAGRDQVQNDGLIADHKGVPGIVTTLIANNLLGVFGVDVDHFPFAFVTPLGTDNDDVCHVYSPSFIKLF
jgi:hypothetical protein